MADRAITWWAVGVRVVLGMAFALLLLDSLATAVRWWRGELASPGLLDWIEVGLLPVLLLVYLRYFSILRPDCPACEPPQDVPQRQRRSR